MVNPAKNDIQKSKGGAPWGNRSRERHGLHASKLPADAKYLENQLNKFRRHVEQVVIDQTGEITLYCAAVIQSSLRHERRCRLLERWLRIESDKKGKYELKLLDKLTILAQISQATDARDKCLQRIGLDKTQLDPWASLDSPAFPVAESQGNSDTAHEAAAGCVDAGGDDESLVSVKPSPAKRKEQR